MKFPIIESLRNVVNSCFCEIEFSFENLRKMNDREYIRMYDLHYSYSCYMVGSIVSVHKAGRNFVNIGSHGVFEYDILNDSYNKTVFAYQDKHLLTILNNL